MISLRCGHCGKNLQVRDELAGKRARCPGCGKPVPVPEPAASVSPPPGAQQPAGGEERTLPPKSNEPQQQADIGGVTNPGASLHAPTQSFPMADASRTVMLDEDARRRFETAWQTGKPVSIEDFIAGQEVSHYLATLEELVHIDLEFHWKGWSEKATPDSRPPDVESYLSRFPKLNQPELVQRLVEQEIRVRKRHGDEPALADYEARFPGVKLQHVETGLDLTSFLAPAQQPDEIGRLGPYRVLKVLGAGGMGVVFKAEDLGLRRLVALKAMLPSMASSPSAKERFFREARSAAALKHPHIVTIFQVGEDRGAPFLAMEFLEGEPLDERLKREKRLPVSEVLGIGRQVAEGLAAAHAKGLIHRDIKPANIWLEKVTSGQWSVASKSSPLAAEHSSLATHARILDFGLARALSDRTHLTQTGAIIGTPAYMAPEQAGGKPVDHRCDLFSFGCVLYRMCTGEMAFKGDDTISILSAIALHTPTKPAELNADVPEELSELIMSLLAKDAEQRPFSAQEAAKALAELEADANDKTMEKSAKAKTGIRKTAAGKTTTAVSPLGEKAIRRKKWPLFAGAAGMVAAVALVIFFLASRERQRPEDGEKQTVALPATFTNSLGMEFVLVPKGKSWLGGGNGKPGTKEVEFKDDFYLGKYEVTQEEWQKVMGKNPSFFSRTGTGKAAVEGVSDADLARFPVENVSWDDTQAFLKALNAREGDSRGVYRLPTEAEWEYACRGGPLKDRSESAFDFYFDKPSTVLQPDQANFDGTGVKRTCKVGSYRPNRLGLYDMHGNVWEWCENRRNLKGADGELLRENRGGCWSVDSKACRAWYPGGLGQSKAGHTVGLRLARVPVGKETVNPTDDPQRRVAEWILRQDKRNRVYLEGHSQAIASAQQLPAGPFKLVNVILWFSPKDVPEDEWLARLSELPNPLWSLFLTTNATDETLKKLGTIPATRALKSLWIFGGPISDGGLKYLRALPQLTTLNIFETDLTNNGLKYIRDNLAITELGVGGKSARLTPEGLVHLNPRLTDISLAGPWVTDAALDYLMKLPKLVSVGLPNSKVTEAGVRRLVQRYPNLETLGLNDTPVSDKMLPALASLKSLRRLWLLNSPITDDGLKHLYGLKKLKELDLRGTKVTAPGVQALRAVRPKCTISSDFPASPPK